MLGARAALFVPGPFPLGATRNEQAAIRTVVEINDALVPAEADDVKDLADPRSPEVGDPSPIHESRHARTFTFWQTPRPSSAPGVGAGAATLGWIETS